MSMVSEKRHIPWLKALMLGVILLAVVSRFVNLEADFPPGLNWSADLYTDEGWYSGNAIAWALTGNWYVEGDFNSMINLPVFPLIQMASFRLLGVSLFSARLTAVLFSVGLLGLVYLLVRRFSDTLTALLAAMLLAVNFTVFAFSRLAFLEIPLTTFFLLSLWLACSLPRHTALALSLSVVAFAAAAMTKTTALPLLPALLYMVWIRQPGDKLANWKQRLVACGAVLAGVVVILLTYNLLALHYYRTAYLSFYFNAPNLSPRVELNPTFFLRTLARILYHGIVLDQFMYPLTLALTPIFLLAFKEFRRNPLVILSIIWFGSYAVFLGIRGYLPPRYYLPLSVPIVLIFCLMIRQAYMKLSPSRLAWIPAGIAAVVVLLNLVTMIQYMRAPQFSFRDLGLAIHQRILAEAGQPAYILGNLGNSVSLSSQLPSISTELGSRGLSWKVERYQPGYFISLGEQKSILKRLGAYYQIQPLSRTDVFNNYYLGKAVYFYKLTEKPAQP